MVLGIMFGSSYSVDEVSSLGYDERDVVEAAY